MEGDAAGATIRRTAIVAPVGLLGLLHWHASYPLHRLVFAGMLQALITAASNGHPE